MLVKPPRRARRFHGDGIEIGPSMIEGKSCRISRQGFGGFVGIGNNVSIRKATIGRHQRGCAAALQPGTIADASRFRKCWYRTSEHRG
jgi:hypothetical protein